MHIVLSIVAGMEQEAAHELCAQPPHRRRKLAAAVPPLCDPQGINVRRSASSTRASSLDKLLGDDIHAKRVLSLANGVAGILSGAVLSIHAIGQAYARLADIEPKSGIKQLDRLLSNKGIDLDVMMPLWIEFVIAARTSLVVALDWTDFDDDDHTTLCAYLITKHGRATPLAWKTYK